MRKNNAKLVGVAVTALIGMTAWAGVKNNYPVYVSGSSTGGSAWGSLGTARNSSDTVQYIGCHTWTYSGGGPYAIQVICYAQSASSVYGDCFSHDPAIVAAAQTLKGDSILEFQWNSNSECTMIRVSNASQVAPKNP